MLEKILPYEENLFFLINSSHNSFFDHAMWVSSNTKTWIPLALFLIISIIYNRDWKQWLPVLTSIILVFVFCDQFSSGLIKPFFARPRPTHYPGIMEHVRTLHGYCGGKYGFISGHATNAFGFAMLTALFFRNRLYTVIIFYGLL